jgi:hypothetical protein
MRQQEMENYGETEKVFLFESHRKIDQGGQA